jgi:oligopeptide/dipeptide ABC transporter ATP-binding protein
MVANGVPAADLRPATDSIRPILEIKELSVSFPIDGEVRRVVAGIDFLIAPGQTVGLVGESGCGKSMTALALMGLVPPPGRVFGSIRFDGEELSGKPEHRWRTLRGNRMAVVFQEPMTALNPVMTVRRQIAEAMVLHQELSWREAEERAVDAIAAVGIPSNRSGAYPHELSGGMRQRAMIAMALSCRPALLIADEPTTALDVTIQAQILELMFDLQSKMGMAILFISHNLAVISEIADEIIVMYAGRIVERARTEALFAAPRHPYTRGLIDTLPDPTRRVARLPIIPSIVHSLDYGKTGCCFCSRCAHADANCRATEPPTIEINDDHFVACFNPLV